MALLAGLGRDAKSGVTAAEAAAFADQAVAALRDAISAGWARRDELKEPDFDAAPWPGGLQEAGGGAGGQGRAESQAKRLIAPQAATSGRRPAARGSPWPSWVRTSNRTVPPFRVGSLDLAYHDRMRQRSILMPLRDHFRPPVWNQASWEGFHGGWPMMMVLNLAPKLPKGFAAEPRVHLGTYFEIDVCTFDKDGERDWHSDRHPVTNGGAATATLAPPAPRSRSTSISRISMFTKS